MDRIALLSSMLSMAGVAAALAAAPSHARSPAKPIQFASMHQAGFEIYANAIKGAGLKPE